MALDPDALYALIDRCGPMMFHVSPAEVRDAVLVEGLSPGSDRGAAQREDFFRPRAGRVYLIRADDVPVVEIGAPERPRVVFRVDLRLLDASRMDPDEDTVVNSFGGGRPGWIGDPPPRRDMDEDGVSERPGQVGAQAKWADAIDGFDASSITIQSLEAGRLAYRGTIPTEAIEVVQVFSFAPMALYQELRRVWGEIADDLPAPPEGSVYRIEADRALAVAEATADRVRAILAPGVPSLLGRVRHPEDLADLADALRAPLRAALDDPTQRGVASLAKVAEMLRTTAEMAPESGWANTQPLCTAAGVQAGVALTALAEEIGADAALAAARTVLLAAVDAPRRN